MDTPYLGNDRAFTADLLRLFSIPTIWKTWQNFEPSSQSAVSINCNRGWISIKNGGVCLCRTRYCRSMKQDEVEPFWVSKPRWSLKFYIEENMKMRVVNGNVEWEFSSDTAHLWSSILAILLITINNQITEYRKTPAELRKRSLEPKETSCRRSFRSIARYFS